MAFKVDAFAMLDSAARSSNPDTALPRQRVRALTAACAAHVLHDGYTDLLYVLLPIWKAEFGLGYAALGILRASYSAAMATAQVPVDRITRSLGPRASLVGGTFVAVLGFILAGISRDVVPLCLSLAIAGLGSSTQHPRASAIVTQAFGTRSRGALGVYNFAGDVGKALFPAVTAMLLIAMSWHVVTYVLAAIGVVFAAALFALLPTGGVVAGQAARDAVTPSSGRPSDFWILFVIGALDTAPRMGFLLFLPFILAQRNASHAVLGIGLGLVFAGGAFGKFTCGWLGERLGMAGTVAITECVTAVLVAVVPLLPLTLILFVLPILGVALNGTSSVLYGTVPDVANNGNVGRAFALFYTGVIGAGALAPIVFGALADYAGRNSALIATAVTAVLAIPFALVLHGRLRDRELAL